MSSEPNDPAPDAVPDENAATGVNAARGEQATGDAPAGPERGAEQAGGVRKILVGVLLIALVGIVAYGVRYLAGGSARVEAGDCVSVTAETDNRADVKTLDCSADKASFKVGEVLDAADAACPEEGLYAEIASGSGDGYKLCLLPNMAEGACYGPDEGAGFVKSPCTGPSTFKVTKVVRGTTDLAACPDSAGMSYPEPPVTYCVEPAER